MIIDKKVTLPKPIPQIGNFNNQDFGTGKPAPESHHMLMMMGQQRGVNMPTPVKFRFAAKGAGKTDVGKL